ncbi:MAG: hypothetical protein K2G59_00340, partial [Muribaculaceae bacterium]|nr:hypothetical protein [Muribaculaceae bacterium]
FLFSTLTFINIASSQQSAKNAQKHATQQPPAHHQKLAKKAPKSAHGISSQENLVVFYIMCNFVG